MSKPKQIDRYLRAAAFPSEEELRQAVVSRDVTRQEKLDFLEVCRTICPQFQIADNMKSLLNDIMRWCLMLDGKYDPDKGLWLWGGIGTGKSTMLEIVRGYCHWCAARYVIGRKTIREQCAATLGHIVSA